MSTPEHKSVLQSGSGPSWSGSGPLPEGPATDAVTFGRFQVLGEAGRGAMGAVYAAYDPHLDRRVALKVLRGEANRGEARERTRREAIALAQVSHPNVVHAYEVGEAKRRLFIAMEYVDGPTLKAWLREGQPTTAVVEVLLAMAKGLGAAHARGLVHRDLKPSNVLIGADGRPRIIDFGLARRAERGPQRLHGRAEQRPDPHRAPAGHPGVHGARADGRRRAQPAQRPVQLLRHRLRGAVRCPPVAQRLAADHAPRRQDWQGRSHFFAMASTLMRRILVDHARKKNAARRGGGRPSSRWTKAWG